MSQEAKVIKPFKIQTLSKTLSNSSQPIRTNPKASTAVQNHPLIEPKSKSTADKKEQPLLHLNSPIEEMTKFKKDDRPSLSTIERKLRRKSFFEHICVTDAQNLFFKNKIIERCDKSNSKRMLDLKTDILVHSTVPGDHISTDCHESSIFTADTCSLSDNSQIADNVDYKKVFFPNLNIKKRNIVNKRVKSRDFIPLTRYILNNDSNSKEKAPNVINSQIGIGETLVALADELSLWNDDWIEFVDLEFKIGPLTENIDK